MKLHHTLLLTLTMSTFSLVAKVNPAAAEQWYFWVENNSNATIQKLLVSENKRQWNYFDIGTGIASGEKTQLVWDESTNNQSCSQWIKAQFSDGSESKSTKIDFCQDLENPIVFE